MEKRKDFLFLFEFFLFIFLYIFCWQHLKRKTEFRTRKLRSSNLYQFFIKVLSLCWSINSFLTLLPQFDLNPLRANIHISLKGQQKTPGQCARWVQRLLLLWFLYCEIKTYELNLKAIDSYIALFLGCHCAWKTQNFLVRY